MARSWNGSLGYSWCPLVGCSLWIDGSGVGRTCTVLVDFNCGGGNTRMVAMEGLESHWKMDGLGNPDSAIVPAGLVCYSNLVFEIGASGMSERKKEPIERAVGCIGWFWDTDEWDRKRIGVLKAVKNGIFYNQNGIPFMFYRPAMKKEIQFVDGRTALMKYWLGERR